jgi:hypothetical protein
VNKSPLPSSSETLDSATSEAGCVETSVGVKTATFDDASGETDTSGFTEAAGFAESTGGAVAAADLEEAEHAHRLMPNTAAANTAATLFLFTKYAIPSQNFAAVPHSPLQLFQIPSLDKRFELYISYSILT